MTPTHRRLAVAALTVAVGGFLALAGGNALARRAEVDRARREVDRLRRELRAGPHENARDVVARAAEGVDELRARAATASGGGEETTRRVSAALAERAGEAGLAVEQLAEDPRSSIVTASTAGTSEATVRWLAAVDRLVTDGTALVRELSLVALPGDVVRTELALLIRPGNTARAGGAGEGAVADEARVTTVLAWPPPPPDEPGARVEPADPARRPETGPQPTDRPVYLGRIEIGGEARYAVRVEPQGVVAVVGRGDTAFGWTLVGSDVGRLVFEKEGERHEVDW